MTLSSTPRLGRNELCWCGSGRKYKHCHLASDDETAAAQREVERAADAAAEHRHGRPCAGYTPTTRKAPAVQRPEFIVKVRNLAATGEDAWLHVAGPADLGRDQAAVDAAVAYLRARRIEPDFAGDPPPDALAGVQALLDRLVGRGVCRVEPSGVRLRRAGRREIVRAADGAGFTVYVGGRTVGSVVWALVAAVAEDARDLGIAGGLLAHAWVRARVVHELVVGRLGLPEALAEGAPGLTAKLLEVIARDAAAPPFDALPGEAARATGALPYLVGLRAARHDAMGQLLGMGLDEPGAEAIAALLDPPEGHPAWLVRLADLAGADDWDTPDGYRTWRESAEAISEVAPFLDALVPVAPVVTAADQTEAPAPLVPTAPPSTEPATLELLTGATGAPAAPGGAFAAVDAIVDEHAGRRLEVSERLDQILERREALAGKIRDLEQQIRELRDEDDGAAADETETTGQLNDLADEESEARRQTVLEVLAAGAVELERAAAAWSTAVSETAGLDQAELLTAQQVVREYEEMRRQGVLDQLPTGTRARLEGDAAAARRTLHDLLGGREPIRVPVVVAASTEPDLALQVGLPFPGLAELAPGSLQTALAVAIAGVLAETITAAEQDAGGATIDHTVLDRGVSAARLRFGSPPTVTAEDVAEFCAASLADLGRTSAALREAGVSIEARVEPDMLGEA